MCLYDLGIEVIIVVHVHVDVYFKEGKRGEFKPYNLPYLVGKSYFTWGKVFTVIVFWCKRDKCPEDRQNRRNSLKYRKENGKKTNHQKKNISAELHVQFSSIQFSLFALN